MAERFDNRNQKDPEIDFKSFLTALSGHKNETEGTKKSPFKKLSPIGPVKAPATVPDKSEIIEKINEIDKATKIDFNAKIEKTEHEPKPQKTAFLEGRGEPPRKMPQPKRPDTAHQLMPSPMSRPPSRPGSPVAPVSPLASRESKRTVPAGRDEEADTFLMGTREKAVEAPLEATDTVFLPQSEQIAASQMTIKPAPLPVKDETKKLKAPETSFLGEDDVDKVIEKIELMEKKDRFGRLPGEEKTGLSKVALSHISVRPRFTLDQLFETMIREGASDLHIATSCIPALRINGDINPLELPDLDLETSENLLLPILSDEQRTGFEEEGELDFSFDYRAKARFRVSYYRHQHGIGGVFRYIPSAISTLEQLGLPQVIKNILKFKKGLILIAGPGSSGKSTTIASMLEEINHTRKGRIITLERPIEYVLSNDQCLISQREIGNSAHSYSDALWAVLREDPDVIMVSELWDAEDIRQALKISETGHLVIAAIHTVDTTKAIERLINTFPLDEQDQIRIMLSECLLAVIAQRLVARADARGLVMASEILLATTGLATIIREGKYSQIVSVIQTGRNLGMQTMDQSLLDLLERNLITSEMARTLVLDDRFLKRAGIRFGSD